MSENAAMIDEALKPGRGQGLSLLYALVVALFIWVIKIEVAQANNANKDEVSIEERKALRQEVVELKKELSNVRELYNQMRFDQQKYNFEMKNQFDNMTTILEYIGGEEVKKQPKKRQ